jgi:tRNA pseudouridine38-40 synthase
MTLRNFKITIEYDGSGFHGWQRQKHDRSIQAEIESAVTRIVGSETVVIGSGRTDAGVHALGQVANFRCDTRLKENDFLRALNSLLPDSIIVKNCTAASAGFHARYDAKRKTYRYRILNHPLPVAVGRQYVWHIRHPLDLEAMQGAAEVLIGRHDFKAFEGTGSPRTHTIRHVFRAFMTEGNSANCLVFEIEADGFLRFMVRNIVGTLVSVGCGKISQEEFTAIFHSQDRRLAAATAPPQGLFLVRVSYDDTDTGG